jgi:hypothetical protein
MAAPKPASFPHPTFIGGWGRGYWTAVETMGDPDTGGELRASDADRERVAEILRQHCTAGRLDLDEYSERLSRALRARTLPELLSVTSDLPHPDAVVPTSQPHRRRPPGGGVERRAPWGPGLPTWTAAWAGFAIAIAALTVSVYGPLAWAIWVFWVFVAIFVVTGVSMVLRRLLAGWDRK